MSPQHLIVVTKRFIKRTRITMEVILDQLIQHKDWLRAAKELDSLTNRVTRRIA